MEEGLIDDSVLQKQEEALAALDRDPFKDYKFPCSYCDKKFPTDFILDYHLKLVHKGNCYITYQYLTISYTVKLDFKELLNKEQIDFKELFTDYQLFHTINLLLNKELLLI